MERTEEILNYANSFKGKGMEIDELKEIIRLAIIDGAIWADKNPKWKPNGEQIVVLELASKYERVFTPKQIDILIGLKEQLKKLKGE